MHYVRECPHSYRKTNVHGPSRMSTQDVLREVSSLWHFPLSLYMSVSVTDLVLSPPRVSYGHNHIRGRLTLKSIDPCSNKTAWACGEFTLLKTENRAYPLSHIWSHVRDQSEGDQRFPHLASQCVTFDIKDHFTQRSRADLHHMESDT